MGVPPDDQALQAQVFAYLADPATHRGATVRRVDTHASSIFLAGDRALKVKRSIRLPYLDYSSLVLRKAACEAELAINRPSAPQIYRGVVAITRNENGRFEIGGRGTPIEWALDMARFDETRTLDRIARQGGIDSRLAVELADAILRSHRTAEPSLAPWAESIPILIGRNTQKFQSTAGLDATQIDRLDSLSRAAFDRVRDTLTKRRDGGMVRRCHGDLHLANVALLDDRPILFDAIEFDPAMATTDVLYDLAFPVMDLLYFGQRDAANLVLNRYLSESDEANLDGLRAFALFLSIRAAIRANVLVTQAERSTDREAFGRAQKYLALADSLIAPGSPRLVAVGGSSGTGKSVLARALATHLDPASGAVVLRSDVIRKKLFGIAEATPLPAAAYQPQVSIQVYDKLVTTAARILAQGCSVIVDAAYLRENERESIQRVAREYGVKFDGLFLQADLAARLARVATRKNDASDANVEVARLQEHYDIGTLTNWATIDASGPPEQTRDRSLAALGLRH